jgi:hypothetical protein
VTATEAPDESVDRDGIGRSDVSSHAGSSPGIADSPGGDTELVSRLRVIEQQPLAARAAAYAGLHEELVKRLESAPSDERA